MAAVVSTPQPVHPPACSDAALLERWRGGDRRAGDVLVSRHVGAVRSYFRGRISGPDSEDLVQETLSRLTGAIRGFQARSSLRTYVMSIAHNTLNDHLRRGYRRISFESLDDSEGEPATAEHYMLERERHALALACVRSLSPEQRELVERFYWQDTSARELGREKGIPAGTVRRRLFETRACLKKSYSEASTETLRRVAQFEVEQVHGFISLGTVA
jgi:RNA polymerase sigma-70 factor (ECF subfamily)